MSDDPHEDAEDAVTATTDSYGGPVSDEQLADVYLPEGQDEVDTHPEVEESPTSDEPGSAEPPTAVTPPAVEAPD